MPKVPIIMPQLGESIAEATVVRLTAKVGDQVETDQEVIEVETNKAVMSVTTPCKGRLAGLTAEVNETYPVGSTLGYIEASVEDAERLNAVEPPVIAHPRLDGRPWFRRTNPTFSCRRCSFAHFGNSSGSERLRFPIPTFESTAPGA